MTEAIPGPPGLPFLGNVGDVTPGDSVASFQRLAEIYGKPLSQPRSRLLIALSSRTDLQTQYRRRNEALHLEPRVTRRSLRREAVFKGGYRSIGADPKWCGRWPLHCIYGRT
jgi:hypothetical protein